MKNKIIYSFLFLTLFLLISCQKDDDTPKANDKLIIKSWDFITEIDGKPIRPYDIVIDENKALWFGNFGHGLMKIENNTIITHLTSQNSELPDNDIWTLDIDRNGAIWGGTVKGMFKYKENLTIFNATNSDMQFDKVMSIAVDKSNNIWFENGSFTQGGLMKYNQEENNWQIFTTDNSSIPTNFVRDIHVAEDGTIWTGQMQFRGIGGIWSRDITGKEKVYNIDNANLNYNYITQIKSDKFGNIWSGTNADIFLTPRVLDGGIQKLVNDKFVSYNPSDSGVLGNRVSAMEFDDQGNLWAATYSEPDYGFDYELSIYINNEWYVLSHEIENFPNGLNITDIEFDGKTAWIAAPDSGLLRVDFEHE